MTTWIRMLDEAPAAPGALRVAVKDAIDVVGVPTTAGCPQVAAEAQPATADAACLAGFRAAGAHLVGKANLHELCFGVSGVNPWSGTPVNPLDPDRIPGGSSSGSAVAVASGEADVSLGTDTGGSVRVPAAVCGIVGLKTTLGRVPTTGVWPLSASLDTVGPLGRDVAGVVQAMALLDPTFEPTEVAATRIGRIRRPGVSPDIEAALDAALAAAGYETVDVQLPGWSTVEPTFIDLILPEMHDVVGHLLRHPDLTPLVVSCMQYGRSRSPRQRAAAKAAQEAWRFEVDAALVPYDVLALPTIHCETPTFEAAEQLPLTELTQPFNVSGHPAISLPVPLPGRLPTSLQLVGRHRAEAMLCATAARVEAALR